ncbi:hypothetical protein D3C83_314840 [compost metagenome]
MFQPAVNAYVPSWFQVLPFCCWLCDERPTSVPAALYAMKVALVRRFEPVVHHASTVRVCAVAR